MTRKEQFEHAHPIVDTYKGWKIRLGGIGFECHQSIAMKSVTAEDIESIYSQIDEWIKEGLTQDKEWS